MQSILANNTSDVGLLCISPTVAIWCKHKSFRHQSLEVIPDAVKRAYNYGMAPPVALQGGTPGISNHRYLWTERENYKWIYERPRGIAWGEYYRPRDFVSTESDYEGYDPTCIYPPLIANGVTINTVWGSATGSVFRNPYATGNPNAIQYGDLGQFGSWYLAMFVIVDWDNNYIWYKTSDGTLSTSPMISIEQADIDAFATYYPTGTYTYYVGLVNHKGNSRGNVLHLYNSTASGYDYADNLFLPCLYDDSNQMHGTITMSSDSGIVVTGSGGFKSLNSGSMTTGNPFPQDISRYVGGLPPPSPTSPSPATDPNYYLNVSNGYKASFLLSLSSTVGQMTFSLSDLSIKIKNSLVGAVNLTYKFTDCTIYAEGSSYVTGSQITGSITIPASGNTGVVINLPNNVLSYGSSGVYDPRVASERLLSTCTFDILYKNRVIISNLTVRMRNNI